MAALALLAAVVFALVAVGVRMLFDYRDQLVANSYTVHEPRTERRTFDPEGAQAVDVEVFQGVGELELRGGASNLLQAAFTYNVDELRPLVLYSVVKDRGQLRIQHPEVNEFTRMLNFTQYRNHWQLALNDTLPLSLTVILGAGESNIDLTGLNLTRGEITVGLGNATIDLTGPWTQSFPLAVHGGLGELHLRLPITTGVRVSVDAGAGNIIAPGLTLLRQDGSPGGERGGGEAGENSQDNDQNNEDDDDRQTYINPAYGHAPETIEIDVEAGLGEVTLTLME